MYIPSSVAMQEHMWGSMETSTGRQVLAPAKTYTTTKPSHYLVVDSRPLFNDQELPWVAVYHEGNTWWLNECDVYEVRE